MGNICVKLAKKLTHATVKRNNASGAAIGIPKTCSIPRCGVTEILPICGAITVKKNVSAKEYAVK